MIDESTFSTFDNQFYPTPPSPARRALAKFKETRITRLLEPEAGRGDSLDVQISRISGSLGDEVRSPAGLYLDV